MPLLVRIGKMGRDAARRCLRDMWQRKLGGRKVSMTDGYTDGFYDGVRWAAAKGIDAIGPIGRESVLETLELTEDDVEDLDI